MHDDDERDNKKTPSCLIAEIGHATSSVALFDVADGVYRLLARAAAPTTATTPWKDTLRGVQMGINQIAAATGRQLLMNNGELITPANDEGVGVDYFAMTVSAAAPLNVFLVGLLDDVSLASARHVMSQVYTNIVDSISLADDRNEQEQVEALLKQQPDVIFITGGTDGGKTERLLTLVKTVALSLNLIQGERKPAVVYAGNSALREQVSTLLGSNTYIVDNLRPSLEVEQTGDAALLLNKLYGELKMAVLPGLGSLEAWGQFEPVPTPQAVGQMVSYFAQLYQKRVLTLDIGSETVTVALADQDHTRIYMDNNWGMGRSVQHLAPYLREIQQWLTVEMDENAVLDFLWHKSLRPHTVPMSEAELYLEQALARVIGQKTVQSAAASWYGGAASSVPSFGLLIARGSTLTQASRPGQTILMLLDILQPKGIFAVATDRYNVLSALGVLAHIEPVAVVQTLEGGALLDLGWVIALSGRAQSGQVAITVQMRSERVGKLDLEVEAGTIETLPLGAGEKAELSLQPSRRFDIGFGPGKGKTITVYGGAVGVVIDARGRPQNLPKDAAARRNMMRQWLWDIGG
ncbi:MAG: glutamate mutase L [Anaerolineae bacterium]|nr:glutamate mutase L [Anaerolineae bacterium]